MIFCTIGTQAPFDRFVRIVDEVAAHLDEEVIAQVYKSEYQAKNIQTVDFCRLMSSTNYSAKPG